MVEHRDAGRDVRVAAPVDGDPHLGARVVRAIGRGHSAASVANGYSCFKRWAERPIRSAAQRYSVSPGVDGPGPAPLACVVGVLCAAASAPARVARTRPRAAGRAQRRLHDRRPPSRRGPCAERASVVASMPALRIAQRPRSPRARQSRCRGAARHPLRRARRASGRAPPSRACRRRSGTSSAWEWQFTAAHEDAVPDWVLRAASAVTIAVVDTGADLSAPDLAAKNPSSSARGRRERTFATASATERSSPRSPPAR